MTQLPALCSRHVGTKAEVNGSSVTLVDPLATPAGASDEVARLFALKRAVREKFALVGNTSNVELSPAEFAVYLGVPVRWVVKHWHTFTERKHERGGKRWIHLATNQEATWRKTF